LVIGTSDDVPRPTNTRREVLRSAVGLGAFLLGRPAQARAAVRSASPRARSVILVMLQGGMSQLETWDPKPDAPAEIRGEFATIATSMPGLRIGEHMPLLARQAHRFNVIRSVHSDSRNDHSPGMHLLLTGYENTGAGVALERFNTQHPAMGSIIARCRGPISPASAPRFTAVPRRGQLDGQVSYATPAFLGSSCEALETGEAPETSNQPMALPPSLTLPKDVSLRRLEHRLSMRRTFDTLNRTLDGTATAAGMDSQYAKAFQMLAGGQVRRAIDLGREPASVRARYGSHRIGQSLLLARRLVEAGVTYVLVDAYAAQAWDTHTANFVGHRALLPSMDAAVSALIDDLDARGMLDEVIVLVASEMGRSPLIGAKAGRDHWTYAYSIMIAGGGLTRGQLLGSTSPKGERPSERRVTVPEILATVYHQLGIDPNRVIRDGQGRPISILPDPRPIRELIA
jgi:uncharacterized protein (DUF1501 family)